MTRRLPHRPRLRGLRREARARSAPTSRARAWRARSQPDRGADEERGDARHRPRAIEAIIPHRDAVPARRPRSPSSSRACRPSASSTSPRTCSGSPATSPSYAVMPGVLIVEAWPRSARSRCSRCRRTAAASRSSRGIDKVRFKRQVRPGDTLRHGVHDHEDARPHRVRRRPKRMRGRPARVLGRTDVCDTIAGRRWPATSRAPRAVGRRGDGDQSDDGRSRAGTRRHGTLASGSTTAARSRRRRSRLRGPAARRRDGQGGPPRHRFRRLGRQGRAASTPATATSRTCRPTSSRRS